MNSAVIAALCATTGFAAGDVFTAIMARRVGGKTTTLLNSAFKLVLYAPFAILWHHEFTGLVGQTLLWIVGLGLLFATANLCFSTALHIGKNPALVGVVAGCFPASASFVAITFLGQRPSVLTIVLLVSVLTGVVLIGLPEGWRTSLRVDNGILLALVPLVCWGVFGALLNEPVRRLGTPHAWFVVQALVAVIVVLSIAMLYNKQVPGFVRDANRKRVWLLVLTAGGLIGAAEALQALALGSGHQLVIVETLLGSYPAAYFLMAHRIFREPLFKRQWVGIGIVAIAVALLSVSASQI
ncbi:MAG TPA: EamA family transporter [Candidatus Saccharimonadales bacterium]|nr:EamA family transporter [Candidatus Saccharimonadales bacterium]